MRFLRLAYNLWNVQCWTETNFFEQVSDENPSWDLYEWESIQSSFIYIQLTPTSTNVINISIGFFAFMENFDYVLLSHGFILKLFFLQSCQTQICHTIYYMKSPVPVTVQLLWCGLKIALIFAKQTQLPYIVVLKRDMMHLQLHKLKGTLSIWGIAINVRCCY